MHALGLVLGTCQGKDVQPVLLLSTKLYPNQVSSRNGYMLPGVNIVTGTKSRKVMSTSFGDNQRLGDHGKSYL